MLYKFLPITLFVVELGAVYTVATVAAAHVPQAVSETPVLAVEVQEVRIEIISNESEEIDAVSEIDEEDLVSEEREEEIMFPTEISTEQMPVSEPVAVVHEKKETQTTVHTVPFYSQFSDISSPSWQKVGCGIASLAMLIDFYAEEKISVDALLERGINAGAYLDNAGWIHAGLIGLSRTYGLTGESVSLAHLNMEDAFAELKEALETGPVMASVHYTFEPTNPIPHLVVITGVREGEVYYNDPAEASAAGSLPVEKFERAWKKRYISIRPA